MVIHFAGFAWNNQFVLLLLMTLQSIQLWEKMTLLNS